jgi:uncharacterized protein with HEPN domain
MPSKDPKSALGHILENIKLARSFVEDRSFASFSADIRTVYAVVRCLEIISEASRRLPASMKRRHPAIPWSDIAGAGNIYRHNYDRVIQRYLWDTVHENLEPLRAAVQQELDRLRS